VRAGRLLSLLAVPLVAIALVACPDDSPPPPAGGSEPEARAASAQTAPGSATTLGGLYQVRLSPEGGSIPLGVMHDWVVEVATADGQPFTPTRLVFDGGMPQHGHGFATMPRVTRQLAPNRFLVEGVRFHMGGDWTLRIELVGPAGPDVAVFHVQVDG
jgi:hypothetical protein